MGTVTSTAEEPRGVDQSDLPRLEEQEASVTPEVISEETVPKLTDVEARETEGKTDEESREAARRREEEMREFREQLAAKRAQRREALEGLRRELAREREERLRLEMVLEAGGGRAEVEGLERQVRALKDVAQIGGEMLRIRELQVNELKEKLKAIEETGVAYEKEVENMRKLKGLYEERSRAMAISHQMEVEREKARVVAAETRLEIAEEKNRELTEANRELQERISTLDSTVDRNNNEISDLKIQLAGNKEELYNATSQIAIVNNLFSQLLTDPESLDRVTRVLEEHHDLVNHLTEKGNINEVASVLMRVADKDRVLTEEEQDIASNLSKVWRLLVELLGYHSKQPAVGESMPDSCYKSVDTPTGPKLVISVSQTFLRLKDLILEKNSLVKEVGRLKDLNTHLEQRLIAQESRLVEVAEELHKTWDVVNKLKSQHKAIHTHEQVLRYELKHKRMMLNELKQQLEECREMWQMARVKNNQTEKDWKILRKEFADRKHQISSAESGYEESPGDSQDEEDSHKMSDDESDYPSSNSPRCLRIARLQDSEQSTPDRSNTPDVPVIEAQNTDEGDESENSERLVVQPEDSIASIGTTKQPSSDEPPDSDIPGSFPLVPQSTLNIGTSIDLSENLNASSTEQTMSTQPTEDLSVDLESTIQILPWNDMSEDLHQESSQLPTILEESIEEQDLTEISGDIRTTDPVMTETQLPAEEEACSSESAPCDKIATPPKMTTAEEILARREARLKRLEEQCQHLFTKMNNTNKRSEVISSKLVELHEHYGECRGESSTSQSTEGQEETNQLPTSDPDQGPSQSDSSSEDFSNSQDLQ